MTSLKPEETNGKIHERELWDPQSRKGTNCPSSIQKSYWARGEKTKGISASLQSKYWDQGLLHFLSLLGPQNSSSQTNTLPEMRRDFLGKIWSVQKKKKDQNILTLSFSKKTGPGQTTLRSFPGGSDGKESACRAGDSGLIPGLGRSPGEGHGNPLQYSCPENSMDRRAWQAIIHGSQSWTWLRDKHTDHPTVNPTDNNPIPKWIQCFQQAFGAWHLNNDQITKYYQTVKEETLNMNAETNRRN